MSCTTLRKEIVVLKKCLFLEVTEYALKFADANVTDNSQLLSSLFSLESKGFFFFLGVENYIMI